MLSAKDDFISPGCNEALITDKTGHPAGELGGYACDMQRIWNWRALWLRSLRMLLMQQEAGGWAPLGNVGDFGCFSFCQQEHDDREGWLLVTQRRCAVREALLLRSHADRRTGIV